MARATMASGLVLVGVAAALLLPSIAKAGNGAHLRTPVDWSSAPCMTIIDRSQSPIHALDYDIPFEDTEVTQDEVEGSRAHQFFVFCRDRHREDLLPNWITEAEVNAAAAAGLGELGNVDLELHVLGNAPEWAGCFARISADDQRRPITFAAAAEPVIWDTSMLPAGTWVVDGYTYEPWFNMWTPHPGVFKIVDDPNPAVNRPAAALTFAEQTVVYGDEASITGCVDAKDGATMSLSWSNGNINGEPNWEVFSADLPAQSGSFDLAFTPPLEAVSNSVMIKLEVTDDLGRQWTAFGSEYIGVIEDVGGDCEEEGDFVGDPCEEDTGTETETEDDSGGSGGPTAEDGGGSGCACSIRPASQSGLAFWILAGLAFLGWGAGRGRR